MSMSFCKDFPDHNFVCPPPLSERIDNDIKKISPVIPFDLDRFRDFFFKNPDYVIEGYPVYIQGPTGTEFNAIIRPKAGSRICILLSGKTQTAEHVAAHLVTPCIEQWHDDTEKDRMREQLRSVGINPIW